ncbi:MAG TPA: outer membrane protein assembly factor BamA [Bacteroidia bacterium]|nr:outer membrane protein assembly factor BamA [Bacteroidia bacterium]
MKNIPVKLFLLSLFALVSIAGTAQMKLSADSNKYDPNNPKEYVLAEQPTVTGAEHMDKNVLVLISGLTVGDKMLVPGQKIIDAIKNIWKQGLFEDVQVYVTKTEGDKIWLNISVVERPRLSKFTFKGVSKGEANDLRDEIKLVRGKVVTDFLIADVKQQVVKKFADKGYSNVAVDIQEKQDSSLSNSVVLIINVKRGARIKIDNIFFHGNTALTAGQLHRAMKETKQQRFIYSIFKPSKLIQDDYADDKQKIIEKFNSKGYRDARIAKDSISKAEKPDRINIDIWVDQGPRYYFGNINWIGNSRYTTKTLNAVLNIKKGDVYNSTLLNERLFSNPNGNDISSLYMDNGYLFFQVTPVETYVHNDTIDMEMHIYEGSQARVNNVTVTGNDKTNDKIIMRQIRTQPGDLFRKSDVIRTQRELSQLGYFDPEKMNVVPTPNPENGTVDINYTVAEKSSDQIELSGGWGGGLGFVGTAGISLKNFSLRNAFEKDAWKPIPTGDGQEISLRFQSNGLPYQSLNLSFIQPWVGGHKPNSLSFSVYTTTESNGQPLNTPDRESVNIKGASIGYGVPLKFPDDYFSLQVSENYQYYTVDNYGSEFIFGNGYATSLSTKLVLERNNQGNNPIFPTTGADIKVSGEWTPPYSLFAGHPDYVDMAPEQKYKLLEFQKYKFTASWFTQITNFKGSDGKEGHNLVLNARIGFGFLGDYNPELGYCPFDRFYLGGSGLTGYSLIDGREIVAERGYDEGSLSPTTGAVSVAKYTLELRYPISLNPQATVYVLAFADAGNSWSTITGFNPFNVYRAVGPGVRIFLPMFGLLGFDYGWRLDDVQTAPGMQRGQFVFTIGQNLGEL